MLTEEVQRSTQDTAEAFHLMYEVICSRLLSARVFYWTVFRGPGGAGCGLALRRRAQLTLLG